MKKTLAGTAGWANMAMRWFLEEVEGGRGNEVLMKAARQFVGGIESTQKALVKNGLDERLLARFLKALEGKG